MDIIKLAAFSQNGEGGNPAGVAFFDALPDEREMLRIASEVGYSETAFLAKQGNDWRVRYFAPENEVPFCGHATIALGAALGERFGEGKFTLILNDSVISVAARKTSAGIMAELQSPPTWSSDAPVDLIEKILKEFHLDNEQLDVRYPIRLAGAGATHLIIFVKERETLAKMNYAFEAVKKIMLDESIVTINMLWQEKEDLFHSRNAFAFGGVYEDPATGAAAAALAGYLRDIEWNGPTSFAILQGEDMGSPSRLLVEFTSTAGESVKVGGEARQI